MTNAHAYEPDPVEPETSVPQTAASRRVGLFVAWHTEEKFWREVYVRAVAALGAALVLYIVAAIFGIVSREPLRWITVATALPYVVLETTSLVKKIRRRGTKSVWSTIKPIWPEYVTLVGIAMLLIVVAIAGQRAF